MSHKPKQQGFAIMAAIFIIVVLAALAAFVVSIGSAHLASLALDIQGGRALQVARSGMDWGVARVVSNPAMFGTGDCRAGARSVNLGTGGNGDFKGYNGFTVTVECRATAFQDGGALYSYDIIATACNEPLAGACPNTAGPSAGDYIERSLSTQIVCNASGPC